MFTKTQLLEDLFEKYDIYDLSHGIKEDKLGDLMEEYCTILLNSQGLLDDWQKGRLNLDNTDEYLYSLIMEKTGIDPDEIIEIEATTDIEHRYTGGNSKTDVLATLFLESGETYYPISVKQTTVAKVAMAEFDAETIFREVGITDPVVKRLILKHQVDASAINFTREEKDLLTEHLKPYARSFVRWVLTGTAVDSDDLRFPKVMVKFQMSKQDEILDIQVYDIDEYVDSVMLDRFGRIKTGGFGTGLGWTYATGSKGRKIQFKG